LFCAAPEHDTHERCVELFLEMSRGISILMPVLLRQQIDLSPPESYDQWFAVGGIDPETLDLPSDLMMPNTPELFERAFEDGRELWWRMGRILAAQSSADISHAAACASFGSDFGVMLGWDRLVRAVVAGGIRSLVVCDDPYLFRHLAGLSGVDSGRPPGLRGYALRRAARGILARVSVAFRVARAAVSLRRDRARYVSGAPGLIVYGHPKTMSDGTDIYFGDLMLRFSEIWRVLHADCGLARARALGAVRRTVSVHAWGSPVYAFVCLPWVRWLPAMTDPLCREFSWLIRRSAAYENGGGGPAMSRWQIHCQARWLRATRPRAVAWPWENFAWERALVRAARTLDIATVGYQHTVIGPHQINYSARCNPDGLASIPDTVVANGPAYRKEMIDWGLPEEIVIDGGAFRITKPVQHPVCDLKAPIYVALSANLTIAARQVDVAGRIAEANFKVVVKQHPMYPISFAETDNLRRTEMPLGACPALSCVVYCTGASAVDALLAGVPGVRLRFADQISIDVLPNAVQGAVADVGEILSFVRDPVPSASVDWQDLFSPVDYRIWAQLLNRSRY
jgi:hypothetical protein